MAYNEIITGLQVNTGWNLTFNPTGKFPVIAKRAFPTLADAQAYVDDVNGSATEGIVITVTQDTNEKNNGIYLVKSIGDGVTSGELVPAGSGNGSVTATNYTAAKKLATSDNVGQLVYVLNDETSATETDENGDAVVYTKGPYVVSGAGVVAKLGTTSASGDIAGDVETLKGDVATLLDEQIKDITVDGSGALVEVDEELKVVNINLAETYAKKSELKDALTKVEGIEAGAQVNVIETVKVAGVELVPAEKAIDITFDATFDPSTDSENALQHKAVAAIVETLSKQISSIPKFRIEVVDDLPETGETAVVYLVKETGEETNNLYEEYLWTGDKFELLGRQELDLTDYVTSGELATELEPYAKTDAVNKSLESYALKADYLDASTVNGLLAEKVDVEEGYGLISDASLALIETNQKAIAELEKVDASILERVGVLETETIVDVQGDRNLLTATVTDRVVELSLLIGDCATDKDGIATVADVKSYVNNSIEDALSWVDAE